MIFVFVHNVEICVIVTVFLLLSSVYASRLAKDIAIVVAFAITTTTVSAILLLLLIMLPMGIQTQLPFRRECNGGDIGRVLA